MAKQNKQGGKISPTQALPKNFSDYIRKPGLHDPITFSFRYIRPGEVYCLSLCEKDEVRQYKDLMRRMTELGWSAVKSSGGKPGNKTGMGCTLYEDKKIKMTRPANVDPSLPLFGLRAGSKLRLFGVLRDHVFYVLWYDRNHEIAP